MSARDSQPACETCRKFQTCLSHVSTRHPPHRPQRRQPSVHCRIYVDLADSVRRAFPNRHSDSLRQCGCMLESSTSCSTASYSSFRRDWLRSKWGRSSRLIHRTIRIFLHFRPSCFVRFVVLYLVTGTFGFILGGSKSYLADHVVISGLHS